MSSNIFDSEKYQEAAQKAYDFIVRQLNVNNYTLFPRLLENYEDSYTSRIFATVDMPADARVNFPKYIYCDQFYDHEFQGVCTGGHKNTGEARKKLKAKVAKKSCKYLTRTAGELEKMIKEKKSHRPNVRIKQLPGKGE